LLKARFSSLDIFRGGTVAMMILVNTPGSWEHIYAPLDHAKWHGCTPTDLVFPFFLFAVGNAMAFVLPRLKEGGDKLFWSKTLRRSALIFFIGLLLNWFPFVRYNADGHLEAKTFENLRILGVFQRIALCYFFASIIIYYAGSRKALYIGFIILLAYWGICVWAHPADPFSLQGWFGTAIDKRILGENHMYHGEGIAFDPEGFMSTAPAIVQVILGYMMGEFILTRGKTPTMLNQLFGVGCLLVFTGYCWDMAFPINKKIWTSSYVVYTTGLAMLILGVLIQRIEFDGKERRWTHFFTAFGKNPLFIFVFSGVWARLYGLFRIKDGEVNGKAVFKGLGGWMYDHVFAPLFGAMNGSLAYALAHILFFWLICWWLDRRKIYIRV